LRVRGAGCHTTPQRRDMIGPFDLGRDVPRQEGITRSDGACGVDVGRFRAVDATGMGQHGAAAAERDDHL
jgi:hypothetical protein